MIGNGQRFDPTATGHFLITVNMPGNGISWSPTTPDTHWPKGGLSYHDSAAMVQLLVSSLGVERLALIYGFSMGAMFALEYCTQFPRGAAAAVVVHHFSRSGTKCARITTADDGLAPTFTRARQPSRIRLISLSF